MNKKILEDILREYKDVLLLTEDEISKILDAYDKQNEEIIDIVNKLYNSIDNENIWQEVNKYGRLKKLEKELKSGLLKFSKLDITMTTAILKKIANEAYARNVFVLEKNLFIKPTKNIKLPNKIINEILNYNVEGLNFSERIWFNNVKLQQNMVGTIRNGLQNGYSIDRMAKSIKDTMQISKNNAMRLIRTESAGVWYRGQKQVYKDHKIKKLVLIATLDSRTSNICRERDGKVYIAGEEPALPFHPNCRSTYAAYFENQQIKSRLDNQTKQKIKYTTYKEWIKQK
ncbi:minor capsid protein [Anaerophilus nitritogenes]|uniref:minor capsid protein n=1 Tax=Anaerophilus nitritogenes TaxID=2498136 RepID=UPI00101BD6B4|nr:minor capsid protein [Anaerophilus nitritogenes]